MHIKTHAISALCKLNLGMGCMDSSCRGKRPKKV